jgi:prolyl oligopeptidase
VTHDPVTKTIGGVTFEDPFAWLHEDSPEALEWQWARDAEAMADARSWPGFEALRARLREIGTEFGGIWAPRKRGGVWFDTRPFDGGSAVFAAREPIGEGRPIVSSGQIAERNGGARVMTTYVEPSPKGTWVAVAYGLDGDMTGAWAIYEVATGRHVRDVPTLGLTGAGRPGWLPDESGFYLDDRDNSGLHRLSFVPVADGAPERAPVSISERLIEAKHCGLTAQISPDGARAVLVTEPHEHVALIHLDLPTGEARPFVPEGWQGECDGSWLDAGRYLARVTDAMRGRVVVIPADTSTDPATWTEVIPEGEGFLNWAGVVGGRLYVGDLVDVSLRIRVFDLDGRLLQTLPLETPGAARSFMLERSIRPTDALAFTHTTFTRSPVLFVHDPESLELRQIGEPRHRLEGVVVEARFAESTGDAKIPYFLVGRADLEPGKPHPAVIHGYGGFNVALLPAFATNMVPFIEAGGVYVHCCLRGGSEYGKPWHDAGRLFNKQNTFDDLFAVAEAVIAEDVSRPELMAMTGASNGGLLAGAAIAQRPDLWRAVAPVVPIFDMMEPLPDNPEIAGVAAIFYEDYGDPGQPEHARSVIGWSPYHNVAKGVAYPAVYQVFGDKDLGCMPFHGRKFTGRLREANTSDRPIHLRIWRDTGHGVADPDQAAAYHAEYMAFIMRELGMSPPPSSASR